MQRHRHKFESVVKPEDPQTNLNMETATNEFESVVKPEDPQTEAPPA